MSHSLFVFRSFSYTHPRFDFNVMILVAATGKRRGGIWNGWKEGRDDKCLGVEKNKAN